MMSISEVEPIRMLDDVILKQPNDMCFHRQDLQWWTFWGGDTTKSKRSEFKQGSETSNSVAAHVSHLLFIS